MIDESYLHLLSGIAFFAGSTVLAYFSAKSKGRIRQLAIIFLVFTVIHSFYHEVGGQAVLGRQKDHPTPWLTERHGY
ncbi:MAG: hypothetical protein QN756_02125, partial [Nitrososphaeraceae archaeon]|nr:hypothetical protein [Nitrososphaeraceae archaeon]